MRRAGIQDGNPGHPDLLALIAAGATDAEFEGVALMAAGKRKGFAYAIGALKRQREEAAALTLHQGPMPAPPPAADPPWLRAQAERVAQYAGRAAAKPTGQSPALEVIHGTNVRALG